MWHITQVVYDHELDEPVVYLGIELGTPDDRGMHLYSKTKGLYEISSIAENWKQRLSTPMSYAQAPEPAILVALKELYGCFFFIGLPVIEKTTPYFDAAIAEMNRLMTKNLVKIEQKVLS